MNVKKICIVGGGSSGWFTAALLSRWCPEIDVTLIESPNVPTVGVGESTVGHINAFLNSLGMNTYGKEDWMKACNATYKASIRFEDFHVKGESFHYPFGLQDASGTVFNQDDWLLKYWLFQDKENPVEFSDFVDSFYPQMPLVYENKPYFFDYDMLSIQHRQALDPWDPQRDYAYQVDATMLAHWMRDNICLPTGLTHIKDDVTEVLQGDNGWVTGLKTKENGELTADLYVDCTGFKSLLLGEAMQTPYHSWSEDLPNNKAWAAHKPYTDDIENEMVMWTNCVGLENGWAWNIPLWNHVGVGYVFSDKFTDSDDALAEFQKHIGHGDDLDYKLLDIKNGRYNKPWVKNVVAIGLSNGFVEPLESSGLVTVHEALDTLIRVLKSRDGFITQYDRDSFSFVNNEMFDCWKYFVSGHFYMSRRDDSEYWRWWTQEKEAGAHWWGIDTENSHHWPSGIVHARPIMRYVNSYDFGMELAVSKFKGDSLYGIGNPQLCIAMGNHFNIYNDYTTNRMKFRLAGASAIRNFDKEYLLDQLSKTFAYWKSRYEVVSEIGEGLPNMYNYLKDNIHK